MSKLWLETTVVLEYEKVFQSIFRIIVLATLKLDYVDHNIPKSGCFLVNQ